MKQHHLITDYLHTLFEPGDVFEVRVLDAQRPGMRFPHVASGYFEYARIDEVPKALDELVEYSGVYVTINPVRHDLLARANHRLKKAMRNETTKDDEVVKRRWMLVDVDPVRPAGISATDSEKAAALDKAIEIKEGFASIGWPDPVVVDSGNGTQLLYRIELPNDDGSLVQRCLQSLKPCSTETVHIDQSVHNAARISRLPGTWNRKGDETDDRPHRMAKVLETPENIVPASVAQMEAITDPPSNPPTVSGGDTYSPIDDFNERGDIASVLTNHGWTLKSEGDQQYWFRPGKTSGSHSATFNGKVFYTFSSSAEPFEPSKGYSPYHVYAKLEHADDFGAATKALREQGYGVDESAVDLSGILASVTPQEADHCDDRELGTSNAIEEEVAVDDGIEPLNVIRAGKIEIKAPQWLLRGMLEQDSFAMIFGSPEAGKSFLAIDWGCRVATGEPWRGHDVKQGAVYYLAGEGQSGIGRRFKAWAIHNATDITEADIFVVDAISATNVVDQMRLDKTVKLCGKKPMMIVLDTLARNFGGGDENSTQDMSHFIAACDAIRKKYKCTLLVVHHSGHDKKDRARGSIALTAALDASYKVVRERHELQLALEATKMKDAEIPPPLEIKMTQVELPGLVDDHGYPVTSLALEVIDADVEAVVSQARAQGQQAKERLTRKQSEGLEIAKSLASSTGVFDTQAWHDECQRRGMSKATRYRVLDALAGKKLVATEGEHGEIL